MPIFINYKCNNVDKCTPAHQHTGGLAHQAQVHTRPTAYYTTITLFLKIKKNRHIENTKDSPIALSGLIYNIYVILYIIYSLKTNNKERYFLLIS